MLTWLKTLLGGGPAVGPHDAVALINRGACVIDVRQPGEFAGGHIRGAHLLPLSDASVERVADLLRRHPPRHGAPLLLVCASGARSRMAQATLRGRLPGVEVINLAGGILAWGAADLPLARS